MLRVILGFVVGAFIGALLVIYHDRNMATSRDIIFPDRSSLDSASIGDEGFVATSGTLTGAGIKHKNNVAEIACYKADMRCIVFHLDQIGGRQLGDVFWPVLLPVSKWQPLLIEATSDHDSLSGYPTGCIRLTVDLLRKAQHSDVVAEVVEQPINQARSICQNTPNNTRKWTLERPAFWRR